MIPDVPTDLAEKALQADVRNALQSVAHGDQLPAAKRQLFIDKVMADAAPQEILEVRYTALLRKFASGGRLRKEEIEEIAHLLPTGDDPSPSLKVPASSTGYLHPYKHYESIYGKKMRTIQWWVAQGEAKEPPNKPPLDDAGQMPVWWSEVMSQKCPPSVLDAARAAHTRPQTYEAEVIDPGALPESRPPSSLQSSAPERKTPAAVADFEIALLNLQLQRDRAYELLIAEQSKKEPDLGKINGLKKDWRDLDDATSKKEAQVIDLRAEMGRYVDKDDIAAELGPMLNAVSLQIRVMWRRIKSRMLKAQDESEEDAIWQDGLDEAYGELERGGYTTPFSLSKS